MNEQNISKEYLKAEIHCQKAILETISARNAEADMVAARESAQHHVGLIQSAGIADEEKLALINKWLDVFVGDSR